MTNKEYTDPVFRVEPDEYGEIDLYEFLHGDGDRVSEDFRRFTPAGSYLRDDDFYQGLNKVAVFVDNHTGDSFGYDYWDDISKHGETYIEANGDEFGLESEEDDYGEDVTVYLVFRPVKPFNIVGYN